MCQTTGRPHWPVVWPVVPSAHCLLVRPYNLNTSKSPGPNMLHPGILYESWDVIAYPLFLVYTRSLQFGKVPIDWICVEVTAIYKEGSEVDRANYRPVSLTSVCCKMLESLIWDHILSYLLENELLSNRQYRFIKGRSTMLQPAVTLYVW